ncbi:unnamed protein product [Amoebophrya sp. A120]|nr:unnamed protein product [Amoebophrya sp. A120]|eukprot:GSA120T00001732001.1
MIVTSDASGFHWGLTADGDEVRHEGDFSEEIDQRHSNKRDLTTVAEWLKKYGERFAGRIILLRTDNTSAMHYINFGTGRKQWLAEKAKAIKLMQNRLGIKMLAQHVRGKHNVIADAISRLQLSSTLYDQNPSKRLKPEALSSVCSRLKITPTVDAMRDREGHSRLVDYFKNHITDAYQTTDHEMALELSWWHPGSFAIMPVLKKLVDYMKVPEAQRPRALVLVPKYKSRLAYLHSKFHTVSRFQKNKSIFQVWKGASWVDLPPTDDTYLVLSTVPAQSLQTKCEGYSESTLALLEKPKRKASQKVKPERVPLVHVRGSILADNMNVIAHQTNCLTIGKAEGIAKKILFKYPPANTCAKSYKRVPGTADLRKVSTRASKLVANLYGQHKPGLPPKNQQGNAETQAKRLAWFQQALGDFFEKLKHRLPNEEATAIIGFPARIGCCRAGGNWSDYLAKLESFAVRVSRTWKNGLAKIFDFAEDN